MGYHRAFTQVSERPVDPGRGKRLTENCTGSELLPTTKSSRCAIPASNLLKLQSKPTSYRRLLVPILRRKSLPRIRTLISLSYRQEWTRTMGSLKLPSQLARIHTSSGRWAQMQSRRVSLLHLQERREA